MRCPVCDTEETRVVDSRTSADAIRRRRECLVCGARFTTFERVEQRQLWVTKRSGEKQPFLRDKVAAGISLACRKRPSSEQVDELVDRVIKLLEERREQTVPSTAVGEACMAVLREVDEVAYVRFASVYQAFESVDQFVETIAPLRATR
ncbi:MAG: transcriptional repressor NrdR [Alphaproteobacteria bacterium]|nr:transcriptional repressor NrdR [Alphaproteobacteria bacterium]